MAEPLSLVTVGAGIALTLIFKAAAEALTEVAGDKLKSLFRRSLTRKNTESLAESAGQAIDGPLEELSRRAADRLLTRDQAAPVPAF